MEVVLLVLPLLLSGVSSHSIGAGSSACTTLIPGHSTNTPQPPATSPYSVTTSTDEYSAGGTVTVTLSGTQSFKGFLLVATNSSNGDVTQTVGTLTGDAADTRNMCDGNKAITHNKPLNVDSFTVTWTAPGELVGNVYFYASFVEQFDTFWTRIQAPGVWDGVSDRPVAPTDAPTQGVIGTLREQVTLTGCKDQTKACWRSCNDQDECDFVVTYVRDSNNENIYNFEIFAANVDGYVALGIAPGPAMSDVSIVACIADESAGVKQFYASGRNAPDLVTSGPLNSANSEFRYDIGTKTMNCRFTYDNNLAKDALNQWKDLSSGENHRMLLARGGYVGGNLVKHTNSPEISVETNFNKIVDSQGTAVQTLVKAHGALMILAWVLCASIGIIMARFYKPMWVEKKACGQKIWFQVHRAFMLAAMFISLIAFIIILVHKQGLYTLPESLPTRAHPILGLIAIICSILNPLIAAFRCHPGDRKRPIFNWFHWFFGTVAHVFAVVAIFIGMMFDSAEVPYWLIYVMMAYALVHFFTELILEIQNCCMYDKNRDRREEFELTGKGPGSATEPPFAGRNFRCAMLVIYLILVSILALVMIFVVAFVRG